MSCIKIIGILFCLRPHQSRRLFRNSLRLRGTSASGLDDRPAGPEVADWVSDTSREGQHAGDASSPLVIYAVNEPAGRQWSVFHDDTETLSDVVTAPVRPRTEPRKDSTEKRCTTPTQHLNFRGYAPPHRTRPLLHRRPPSSHHHRHLDSFATFFHRGRGFRHRTLWVTLILLFRFAAPHGRRRRPGQRRTHPTRISVS